MTTPPPDSRRRADQSVDDAMETFVLRAPRWLTVLFGRNPLIRITDRLEALALVLAVAVSLFALPVAAAVGTAVHDSRSRAQAERAESESAVTATVIDHPARGDLTRVHARWSAAGAEHTGAVRAPSSPKPGDSIEILVNADGSYAGPPPTPAARVAVFVALAVWLNVATAAVVMFLGARALLNRARDAGWRTDSAHLASDGNERTNRH